MSQLLSHLFNSLVKNILFSNWDVLILVLEAKRYELCWTDKQSRALLLCFREMECPHEGSQVQGLSLNATQKAELLGEDWIWGL